MTFLRQQKLGNNKWLSHLEAKSYLWAAPGPYLRESMLRILAKQVSDDLLPEVFHKSTFQNENSCPNEEEKEKDLAKGLNHLILDAHTEMDRNNREAYGSSSDETDSDEEYWWSDEDID